MAQAGSTDAETIWTCATTLWSVPDLAIERIVDSLSDHDFAMCMMASQVFWVCSASSVRARRLSKTLAPKDAVLLDTPEPVLAYMQWRRGIRFRPVHLRRAAKRGCLGAVRWLVDNSLWTIDDASSIADWLAADGLAPLGEVEQSDMDAAIYTTYGDSVDTLDFVRGGGGDDATCIRVPLCLCHVMDAAADKGHMDVVRFLDGTSAYGCTDSAVMMAALSDHADVVGFLCKNRVDIGCQSNAVTDAVASGRVEMAVRLHQTHGHRCYGGALASILMRDRVRLVWRADTDAEPVYGMYKGDHDAGGTDDDDYDSDDDGDDDCQDRALATLTAVLEYPGLMEPRRLAASIDRALYFAVLRGFIEVVKALHERWGARLNDDGPPPGQSYRDDLNFEDPVSAAAKCNDVRMLKYMTTHGGVVLGTDPLDVAARAGALPAVKYLVSVLNAPCSTRALDWAASSGHDNTVAYLLDKRAADCDMVSALTAAIAAKRNAVVSVLLEHVSAEDIVGVLRGAALARGDHERLCRALVLRGHTDVERFPLPTPGGAPGVEAMRHAIRKASGDPCALRAIIAAHPDVARRAYHGIGVHDWTAMEGATGALVVLHEYGIGTITHRAMCNAAFNGHIETMRTLFNIYGSTGPWVGRNLDESVANGHQGVLRFMQDNFDWRWWTPRAVDKAAADGRISAVRFLYAHRPTDDSPWCTEVAMDAALDRGHWEMAAFLHAAGARCSPKGLEAAKPPCGCRWVPPLIEAIAARCRGPHLGDS